MEGGAFGQAAEHSATGATGPTPRWGMVVDLNRCVGCQTCAIACKQANDTPPGVQWRQVLDIERGEYPDVKRLFLVTGCQHCAQPSCVPVCPTGATAQRADGLVTMDYALCIGCGYCAVACPYQARTIVHDRSWYYGEAMAGEDRPGADQRIGVANKCTFCVERIDEACSHGRQPGSAAQYTPACAASCIANAIQFGDFADAGSPVSQLLAENAHFQMHADLGNDPQIKYLYEIPGSMPGRDALPEEVSDAAMSDTTSPLVGRPQTFWDFRAAMNFIMGGMSTGLVILVWFAHQFARLSEPALVALQLVAGVGMAVGLFFVFMEIARKLRFLYVLRRPQSSWMTRETYFVALFYPAVAADLIWPQAELHAVVALAAAGFLYCQARILHAGKGIPAWRHPMIPAMLIATGLYEGAGLLAVAGALSADFVIGAPLYAAALGLAGINAALWWRYRATAAAAGVGPLARRVLDEIAPSLGLAGHAAPAVLFAGSLAMGDAGWLAGIGGLGAIAGGVLWKFAVITRACHQQGFAVPKMPQRGSGRRAAPVRL